MQKIFAGIFLSVGFVFLLVSVSTIFNKNPTKEDQSAALGGLIIGVPSMAAGLVIVQGIKNKKKQLELLPARQLEAIFLQALQENDGKISIVNFAISSKLSLEESKEYLDKKASQLNGDFDVAEDGKISYHFDFR